MAEHEDRLMKQVLFPQDDYCIWDGFFFEWGAWALNTDTAVVQFIKLNGV